MARWDKKRPPHKPPNKKPQRVTIPTSTEKRKRKKKKANESQNNKYRKSVQYERRAGLGNLQKLTTRASSEKQL